MKKVFLKVFLIVMIFVIAGASTGSILKAEPLQTPPYAGMRLHPESDAVNVPLDTSISLYSGRLGVNATGKLNIKPKVEIGNVTTESEGPPMYGGSITFYPAKPLSPNTKYNVTMTILGNGNPRYSYSWQFTTTAETPRAAPGLGIVLTVMAILLGLGWKYLGKKSKSR